MTNMAASALENPELLSSHMSMMSAEELQLVQHTWLHGIGVDGDVSSVADTLQQLGVRALTSQSLSSKIAVEKPQQGIKVTYMQLNVATARFAKFLRQPTAWVLNVL